MVSLSSATVSLLLHPSRSFGLGHSFVITSRLRLEEAVDMLAVDMESNPPAFDEENRMVDSEEILKMCGSLVRLNTNAEGQTDTDDTAKFQTLTAAHTSVIDFLTTQPIKIGSEEVFSFSRAKANLRMAETCLIYLRYFSEKGIILTGDNIASYPFAQQCALIWDVLYREVLASPEQVNMTRLNGLVRELLLSSAATLNWLKLNNPDEEVLRWLELRYPDKDGDFGSDTAISGVKPAIYYAAHLGFPEIVRSLIQREKTLDEIVGPPFGTLLVAASARGRTDVVSLLLDSGADPNVSAYFYYGTPLAAAIEFGRCEIVELLLGRKDIKVNGIRHPPLEVTNEVLERVDEYRYFQSRRVRRTIRESVNLHKDEEYRSRCIEFVMKIIKLAETARIQNRGHERFKDRYGTKELISASLDEKLSHSTLYKDVRAEEKPNCAISDDVNKSHYREVRANAALERVQRSTEGMIYIAAEYDREGILEILLAAGADPNVRGGWHGTALQKACVQDSEDGVEILLKNGAKTDVYGGWYGSSLHAACAHNNIRMIESIILAGADVNRVGKLSLFAHDRPTLRLIPDAEFNSPLFQASRWGHTDVVELLLKYGAEIGLHADERVTPLAVASETGSIETVKVLLDAGSDVNLVGKTEGRSPLITACAEGRLEIAKLLVEAGADIDATNLVGHSALLAAVSSHRSQLEVFEYLIRLGADPLQRHKRGSNALHYAARAKKSDVIKRILECGENVNATDWNGWSSLHWAIASTEDSTDIVRLLLQSGVDKTVKDKQGRAAADLAKTFKRIQEATILGDIQQASTESFEHEEFHVQSNIYRICDGCEVVSKPKPVLLTELIGFKKSNYCQPESWHRCNDCIDFDFCFRCVLDKDIIHCKDHTFSNEPA